MCNEFDFERNGQQYKLNFYPCFFFTDFDKEKQEFREQKVMLIIIENITIQIEKRHLQELENYKNKMLASLSHELRTPLNCSISKTIFIFI